MTDTSPAALKALADDALCNTAFVPKSLLLAIAAEKEAQQPVAWTLQSELDAKKTTCTAHLWFSNPKNSAWTPLYLAPQHHPEQPLEMVAAADVPLPEPEFFAGSTYGTRVYAADKLHQYAEAYANAIIKALGAGDTRMGYSQKGTA